MSHDIAMNSCFCREKNINSQDIKSNRKEDMATKFLYGAAVQGIQQFIFQSNKLKDIVGASELVEDICTKLFAHVLAKSGVGAVSLEDDPNAILFAAGNIKYVFDGENICKEVVKCFPKTVAEYAPGVTVSQAVVSLKDDSAGTFASAVDELERRLRVHRNRNSRSPLLGMMGVLRSRSTGLPVIHKYRHEYYDEATFKKEFLHGFDSLSVLKDGNFVPRKSVELSHKAFGQSFSDQYQIPYELSRLTGKNGWIAVIHADGNGVGQVVRKIGKNREEFKKFSMLLDKVTTQAAQAAFEEVKILLTPGDTIIPIRPVVLGGDDVTVICRGDLALPYIKSFISAFERESETELGSMLAGVFADGSKKLTACAGIAYVKSSYPFYYAYDLAETLCSVSKKDSKDTDAKRCGSDLPESCVMFHKVQDSFVEDYQKIEERELTPCEGYSFKHGPYYLKPKSGRWTVDDLMRHADLVSSSENSLKGNIRNWISLLYQNKPLADQRKARVASLLSKEHKLIFDAVTCEGRCPAYDILVLSTINNQVTK